MSDLLETALSAHGGWGRWKEIRQIIAHVSVGGAIWQVKGWPDVFEDARFDIDPHRQRVEHTLSGDPGRLGVFEPGRTALVSHEGTVIEAVEAPRKSFAGHTIATRWDAPQLVYFAGYAMWTYLTTPFLFKLPGLPRRGDRPLGGGGWAMVASLEGEVPFQRA